MSTHARVVPPPHASRTPWRYVGGFSPYSIFLDGHRNPPHGVSSFPWVVCRTLAGLEDTVKERGIPQFIGMDSDLTGHETGRECSHWLWAYCESKGCNFPRWAIHSDTARGLMLKGELLGLFPGQYHPDGYAS